ncbi:hypothetical protein CEUSTIGMA_g10904.t1 [Chlamydomonas eustigma]|uniref:Histone deacetylase domain-containing protein n=1 Tax=Chlamydomonas eustigma TaxID=1157962 RepID=A0A250XKM3_9CHLO|nr:hypothetical protein CEUSTIGMA_g10904.t1 [Chlamydomonas eustigma]|eukprot:GAX83479.1 hypothetical protein CEUSTIGMA_g10904.t1 [Chlamydomonas eustigma]
MMTLRIGTLRTCCQLSRLGMRYCKSLRTKSQLIHVVATDEYAAETEGYEETSTSTYEPEHDCHPSADVLHELNRLLVHSCSESIMHSSSFCTNCMAPKVHSVDLCSYCGHLASDDPKLLGSLQSMNMLLDASSQHAQLTSASSQDTAVTRVVFASDSRMMLHRTSLLGYPERPERLQAIIAHLSNTQLLQQCTLMPCREATEGELLAIHSPELVSALNSASASIASELKRDQNGSASLTEDQQICHESHAHIQEAAELDSVLRVLDPSMLIGPSTATAARLAAGTAVDVAVAVATGRARAGVAVIRPPGHHASYNRAQGGCYFNNVAVAARAVQSLEDVPEKRRVMIVDWDVHYGHGTQEIFDEDDSVLYVSLHKRTELLYPSDVNTSVEVVGQGSGQGFTVNIAWDVERNSSNVTEGDYMSSFLHVVLPAAHSFQPDVIIVSAGFGSAEINIAGASSALSPACYAQMTHMLLGVAPVALMLEGGFNLFETSRCMEACLRVLLGERPPQPPGGMTESSAGWAAIMNTMQIHGSMWPALRPLSWNGWLDAVKEEQKAQNVEGSEEESVEDEEDAQDECDQSAGP